MKVAMDTSALMAPVETGVRIFEELERLLGAHDVVIPRAVREELDDIATGSGTAARAASVGRDLAARCGVVETEAPYADDALLELAESGRVEGIVTNDGDLKERVLAAGTPVIHLRGRTQLERTNPCTNESG
jgi:rRNA-processing protein FCF1